MDVPNFLQIQGGVSLTSAQLNNELSDRDRLTYVELAFEDVVALRSELRTQLLEKSKNYKIVLSCSSLNIGSTDELNFEVLKSLKEVIQWLKPSVIYAPLSWSALDGHFTFLDFPVPLTESSLELVIERVFRIQNILGQKIALQNLATHIQFVGGEYTQCDFLYEVARVTGSRIVLDVHGLEWNARTWGEEVSDYAELPKELIALVRKPAMKELEFEFPVPHIIYGPSLEDCLKGLEDLPKLQMEIEFETDLSLLEPREKLEVQLTEGVFEKEPRRILMETVTSSFGIRPNVDLAVFEPTNAMEGLAHYNQQYFIQIRNYLYNQFRTLSFMMSGQFDRLIMDFLLHFAPTSYKLSQVGRELEVFIRDHQLKVSSVFSNETLADMARLEYAVSELTEVDDQQSIEQGIMMEIESHLWDRVFFKLNDNVRLIETAYDVAKLQKYFSQKNKLPETPLKSHKTHYLVYRTGDRIQIQLIGRPEAKALRYAWDEMTFIKICEKVSKDEGLEMDSVIQQTFSFIHRWAGLGLVKAFDYKAPQNVVGLSDSPWDHRI